MTVLFMENSVEERILSIRAKARDDDPMSAAATSTQSHYSRTSLRHLCGIARARERCGIDEVEVEVFGNDPSEIEVIGNDPSEGMMVIDLT